MPHSRIKFHRVVEPPCVELAQVHGVAYGELLGVLERALDVGQGFSTTRASLKTHAAAEYVSLQCVLGAKSLESLLGEVEGKGQDQRGYGSNRSQEEEHDGAAHVGGERLNTGSATVVDTEKGVVSNQTGLLYGVSILHRCRR